MIVSAGNVFASPSDSPNKTNQKVEEYNKLRVKLLDVKENQSRFQDQEIANRLQSVFFEFEASDFHSAIASKDQEKYKILEQNWTEAISKFRNGDTKEGRKALAATLSIFQKSNPVVEQQANSGSLFLYSLGTILREGVEAILIIAALIGLLIKILRDDEKKDVYLGVILAILGTVVLAIAAQTILDFGNQQQELIEGITMLLAMVVLFTVNHWLVGKSKGRSLDGLYLRHGQTGQQ